MNEDPNSSDTALPLEKSAVDQEPAEIYSDDSPEDRTAREWRQKVYQGDRVRQLSVRSIITGMLIGAVMSISNLYVGLKTGWGLGVTITACIIAYAVFRALAAVIPPYRKNPFTILENNTMSSAASAAGYMASAGLVSAIPALYLTTGRNLLWWEMMLWLGAVSVLGVFMAVPLKRQLINIDQLPFPSGIATAETLKSMHSSGVEAMQKAKALLWSAVGGAVLALWRDGLPPFAGWLGRTLDRKSLGESLAALAFPESLPLYPGGKWLLTKLTLGFEGSLIMIAAGAIMGIRVGVSLLIGAVIFYGIAPTNMTTNLMTASITAGAASHSADLLTDLKSGYLLGGNPRKQTIAQLFGVLAGTLLCVPVYAIIAQPGKLGSAELPRPLPRYGPEWPRCWPRDGEACLQEHGRRC